MARRLAVCAPQDVHRDALQQWGACLWPARQALPPGWENAVRAAEALVLLADTAQNCAIAARVRAVSPHVLMVARMRHVRGAEHRALLRCGVDRVMRVSDPSDWLIPALNLWLAHRQGALATASGPDGWHLDAHGWWLQRSGSRLRLTVAERALLQALLAAPGRVASEQVLAAALQQAGRQARIRLGDMPSVRHQLSRLRQRARDAGLGAVPIEALSGYGYVWD